MSAYQPPILHNNVLNTVFNPNDFIEPNREPYLPLIGGTISGALKVLGTTTLTGATTSSALITTTDLRINTTRIHLGTNAGLTSQSAGSIAIGDGAGQTSQAASGDNSVAIGRFAGQTSQGDSCVAIGAAAGKTSQAAGGLAIGVEAGELRQKAGAMAIGFQAGRTDQFAGGIAIGNGAGILNQGTDSIAIGKSSAGTGSNSVAIGNAANTSTFATSVAIGASALSTANNQITLGTATETIRLNTITTLYTTIPTFVAGQIGFIYTNTSSTGFNLALTTLCSISSLPIGVYILTGSIGDAIPPATTPGLRIALYQGATQLVRCNGYTENGYYLGASVSYFLNNTSVSNITLQAQTTVAATVSGGANNLQAIKIA